MWLLVFMFLALVIVVGICAVVSTNKIKAIQKRMEDNAEINKILECVRYSEQIYIDKDSVIHYGNGDYKSVRPPVYMSDNDREAFARILLQKYGYEKNLDVARTPNHYLYYNLCPIALIKKNTRYQRKSNY